MGWSGGTYTKGNAGSGGWQGDAGLGIGIEAGRHDTQDNDFATGINNCLTKDGQNTPTANLPMGGYKHTGVGDATAASEYLSYGQLLDVTKAVTTTGTAPAYEVTLTPAPSAYATGQIFAIRIHSTLTTSAGATLNVNGLGAKALKVATYGNSTRDIIAYEMGQRTVYYVVYDATDGFFRVLNPTFGGERIIYTPTFSSEPGSTVSLNSGDIGYYYMNGRNICYSGEINIGLAGAVSYYIGISLPVTASTDQLGLPSSVSLASITGYADYGGITYNIDVDTVNVYRDDTLDFPIDASFKIRIQGFYKTA